jgi:hypothetical protein
MAWAVGAMLVPGVAPAAEKRVISVMIVNARSEQVKAQSPHLENCFPNLAQRIEPRESYVFNCTVWDAAKPTSFVVRLVLPEEKIACEGYWHPNKVSVTYQNNGGKCEITTLGKDMYRFTIR